MGAVVFIWAWKMKLSARILAVLLIVLSGGLNELFAEEAEQAPPVPLTDILHMCIFVTSGSSLETLISESPYKDQFVKMGEMGEKSVWRLSDDKLKLNEDRATNGCGLVSGRSDGPAQCESVVAFFNNQLHASDHLVYSGPNAVNTAQRDIWCFDETPFSSGYFVIVTSLRASDPTSALTFLASAAPVPETCEALIADSVYAILKSE